MRKVVRPIATFCWSLLVGLGVWAAFAQSGGTEAGASTTGLSRTDTGQARAAGKGFLFSAVRVEGAPLATSWAALRDEAARRFPDLRLTGTADLHITVVYIGGWAPADTGLFRRLACVRPTAGVTLRPEITRLGRHEQVVAVELRDVPASWAEAVVSARRELARLGRRKPDPWDDAFRAHVTLAQSKHVPPNEAEALQLKAFQSWVAEAVAASPAGFSVPVGPDTPVWLLLAGADRPSGAPEYVPLEGD